MITTSLYHAKRFRYDNICIKIANKLNKKVFPSTRIEYIPSLWHQHNRLRPAFLRTGRYKRTVSTQSCIIVKQDGIEVGFYRER